MSIFAAILFAGAVFASTTCDIPEGWSYYTQVSAGSQTCTVIRANTCGEKEYKICYESQWYTVTRDGSECYFYYKGQKKTFNM